MIQLNEATHVYTFNGRRVPSVTQALSIGVNTFDFVDPDVLDRARRFGNHCHLMTELFDNGELNEDTLDPELALYLVQYKKFLRDSGFVVTETERIVHHTGAGYAGKFDKKGLWKRTTWLLDLKSGGVPVTVGPQTAAYQRAHPEPPRKRAVLQLMRDRYRVRILEDTADYTIFQSALNWYRFLNKKFSRGTKDGNEEKGSAGSGSTDDHHHQNGGARSERGRTNRKGVSADRGDGGGGRGFF
jgi:hypothetical protein